MATTLLFENEIICHFQCTGLTCETAGLCLTGKKSGYIITIYDCGDVGRFYLGAYGALFAGFAGNLEFGNSRTFQGRV